MKRSLTILLIILLLASCGIFAPRTDGTFGIYMLKDKTLSIYNDLGDAYLSKALDSVAVLTSKDIDYYDWSSHCIYLKTDKGEINERLLDTNGLLFKYPGAPFVVTSDGEAQYYGYFYSLIMSIAAATPSINEMSLIYYPEDVLSIGRSWTNDDLDTRNNENVKQALIDAGLFHAGISVAVDTLFGLKFYPLSSDTMQMEYRFSITNNDQYALYVLDPDKIGTDLFFYFNTAPSIVNLDNNDFLRPNHQFDISMTPDTSDFDDLNWYTLLSPGETMVRTVRTGQYANVTAGRLEFDLRYGTPINTLSKSRRNKLLGRIWIGETQSPKYVVNYTPF
ncbi:MAG: hypothetical protein KAU44_05155 [Candidatus Marinimicrobia bacterium]|nr:hypothetical protein [Candidatus Neomarinimicrobiota bacterium]